MTKLSHLSDHYGLVTDSKQKSKVAKTSQEEPKEVEVMENDDGNKYIEVNFAFLPFRVGSR